MWSDSFTTLRCCWRHVRSCAILVVKVEKEYKLFQESCSEAENRATQPRAALMGVYSNRKWNETEHQIQTPAISYETIDCTTLMRHRGSSLDHHRSRKCRSSLNTPTASQLVCSNIFPSLKLLFSFAEVTIELWCKDDFDAKWSTIGFLKEKLSSNILDCTRWNVWGSSCLISVIKPQTHPSPNAVQGGQVRPLQVIRYWSCAAPLWS